MCKTQSCSAVYDRKKPNRSTKITVLAYNEIKTPARASDPLKISKQESYKNWFEYYKERTKNIRANRREEKHKRRVFSVEFAFTTIFKALVLSGRL